MLRRAQAANVEPAAKKDGRSRVVNVASFSSAYASIGTIAALTFGFAVNVFVGLPASKGAAHFAFSVVMATVIMMEMFCTCICGTIFYHLNRMVSAKTEETDNAAVQEYLDRTRFVRKLARRCGWYGLHLFVVALALQSFIKFLICKVI